MSDLLETLFGRLIDDAGQFPPARKSLEQAVVDNRAARSGPFAWIHGRFLCPASRLEDGPLPPRLGVVSDGEDWEMDLDAAVTLGADAFELRDPGVDAYPTLSAAPVDVFVEAVGDPEALAAHQLGAKIRCGGLTADAFPSDALVAAFITRCRRMGIPFKATAGLHHPFRARDEAIGVLQHGFVNLLAATVLDVDDIEAVVADEDPSAFSISGDGLHWRDVTAGPQAIEEGRARFTAFGSCSTTEPIADLLSYGILEPAHV